ncbi:hypothetical protein ACHAXR_001934 [Thalassiosira sp. AJA248-18]
MIIRRAAVDVGAPPSNGGRIYQWEITPIHIHRFEGLNASRGTFFESPDFTSCGHQWNVRVYPGGNSNSDDGMIAAYLFNMSEESIEVDYGISSKRSADREVANIVEGSGKSMWFNPKDWWRKLFPKRSGGYDEVANCDGTRKFYRRLFASKGAPNNGNGWGRKNFEMRSDILSALVAGTLIINIRMRRTDSTPPTPVPFIPENPLCGMMLKVFMDEESADVVLEVENGDQQARIKFYAHQLILKQCAPVLAELCGSGLTSVPITDINPEIFHHMLRYVYGGKVAEEDLRCHSKEIIEAANRFGVVNLKLKAEASYVKSTKIGVDNVMDHLLYADALNCALLKEVAINFVVENRTEVIEKVSLKDVSGGLFGDILLAIMRKDSAGAGVDDLNSLCITDLRKKLHEKGLDVDGSRETLIATLKENA